MVILLGSISGGVAINGNDVVATIVLLFFLKRLMVASVLVLVALSDLKIC